MSDKSERSEIETEEVDPDMCSAASGCRKLVGGGSAAGDGCEFTTMKGEAAVTGWGSGVIRGGDLFSLVPIGFAWIKVNGMDIHHSLGKNFRPRMLT